MVLIPKRCPYCQSDHVIKGGKTDKAQIGPEGASVQKPTAWEHHIRQSNKINVLDHNDRPRLRW